MNLELIFFILLIASCIVFMLWAWQQRVSVERYLVADRGVGLATGGLSTGAGWIHAPAVLVSGLFAYHGPWHFAAFFVPNVCALLLQAWIAPRVRRKMREKKQRWYTMPQAIGGIYESAAIRSVMFFATFLALALAVGYTFVGIRQWLENLKDIPAHEIAMVLAGLSFVFVIFTGLPAAIKSDKVKMAVISLGLVGTLALFAFVGLGGAKSVGSPLLAKEAGLTAWQVLWFVGIPFAASLFGGPMCNPDLPERLLAIEERSVKLAYVHGAAYFALATLIFGLFGYMARDLGFTLKPGQLPIVMVLQSILPEWGMQVVTAGIIVIFTMALASLLASAGDVVSIEVVQRFFRPNAEDRETITWSRVSMLVVIMIGAYITSSKQMNVAFLQESMAVVRGEAIFPVVFAACLGLSGRIDARYVLWGMVLGFIGGFLFFLGWFAMNPGYAKAFPTIAWLGSGIGQLPFIPVHGKSIAALWAIAVPLIFCGLGVRFARSTDWVGIRYNS